MERNEELRAVFKETIESYPQHMLYYVDECGIDMCLQREYGYAQRGTPVFSETRGKSYKRTNIVAAKCCDKVVAPMIYDGTTDSVFFEHWFEHALLKSIPKYSIIILDNASFHRKSTLHTLAAMAECEVLFLPPYSPDFNIIENFWAWVKNKLRDVLHMFDNFYDALVDCLNFK